MRKRLTASILENVISISIYTAKWKRSGGSGGSGGSGTKINRFHIHTLDKIALLLLLLLLLLFIKQMGNEKRF